jgi:hypothetical protein
MAVMAHRIGTFFILLGIFLIALFLLSDMADAPTCNFFVYGSGLFIIGVIMWFRNPLPAGPPAGRFRLLKSTGKKAGAKAGGGPGGKPGGRP